MSQMTISLNLIGLKKAHDLPYSLLFSFYQLKVGSIVEPSEPMKFPMNLTQYAGQRGGLGKAPRLLHDNCVAWRWGYFLGVEGRAP